MSPTKHDRPARSWWTIGYREARAHAHIVAIILWTGMAIVTFGTRSSRNLIDHLKGEDFVQIYTLAHTAFEGPYPTLRTQAAFHQRQVELVPASEGDQYLPVYPPTAALLFRPLAALSYGWATVLWTMITIAGYGLIVWTAWRSQRTALPDGRFVAVAAAAFPPFFLLVLHGQTTLLPLLAFCLCWLGMKSGWPFAAGVALGLLTVKPQFAIVIGCVLTLGFTWRVLLGFAVSVALQGVAVASTMGMQAFDAYRQTVLGMPTVEHLLEPDAWRMHSVRTLTRLIPEPAGEMLWASVSLVLIAVSVRVWRSRAPLSARLGIVVLATVLVNPHLFGYDAVVLVLPIIWLGGWMETTMSPSRRGYWQAVYLLSALLLLPTALFMRVQLSVLVMLWLFWRMAREAMAVTEGAPLSA